MKRKRTIIGVIRSRMETYEARRRDGFTLQTFVDELAVEGYCISYDSFRVLYSRAKQQLSQSPSPPPQRAEIKTTATSNTKGFNYSSTSINKDSLI